MKRLEVVSPIGLGKPVLFDGCHQVSDRADEGVGYPALFEPVVNGLAGIDLPAGKGQRVRPAVGIVVQQAERARGVPFRSVDAQRREALLRPVVVIDRNQGAEGVRILEHRDGPRFAGSRVPGVGRPGRIHALGLAEKGTHAVEVMDAVEHQVEPLGLEDPGPGPPFGQDTHVDHGRSGIAQPSPVQQGPGRPYRLVPPHLLVHGQFHAARLRHLDDLDGFGVYVGQRFLAQQMLAGRGRLPDEFLLVPGRHGDVHDLHRGVVEHGFHGWVHPGHFEIPGGPVRLVDVRVRQADHVESRLAVGGEVRGIYDPARPDDADSVIQFRAQHGAVIQVHVHLAYLLASGSIGNAFIIPSRGQGRQKKRFDSSGPGKPAAISCTTTEPVTSRRL